MSLTYVDEDAIVRKVEMELKKGGTFDKIRKQSTEHIRESKTVQRIEKEMLEKVDEIMKSSANSSREEIQRKVREAISKDERMQFDINRQTSLEVNKQWVSDTLTEEIQEKVVKQLDEIPEYSRIMVEDRVDEIGVKIGILATYFRVFKRVVAWGMEENGFEHLYPTPEYDFDSNLGAECKKGLETCLNTMMNNISEMQPWILQDNIEMDELALDKIIDNQRIGMEISASQILCWLTNSRVKAFEHIPFCSYRIQTADAKPVMWTGRTFNSGGFIDEFVGGPFECATESFCPDPCCSRVPSVVRSSPKYAPLCKMNTCQKPETCIVKHFENDDLTKLRLNQFNINCGCDKPGTIYRPDTGDCVHHDMCTKRSLCREYGEECVNTVSGPKCVCQLGYIKNGTNSCAPLKFSPPPYHGFAHSEPIHEL